MQQAVINIVYGKKTYEYLYLLSLSVVIVFSAFTGVYYNEEYFTVHILSAICLLICLIIYKKKNVVLASSFLDYLMLAFTLLYIINVAWAVHMQWAFEESLKYINYFLIYWFVAKVINDQQIHSIMKIFVAVGVVLALIGILDYLKIIPFEGAVQSGRITATLKYTNALGSYLLATIVLAHYGINERKHGWLYNLGVYVMVVAFIGTFSRANYLISIPVIIGLYIAYPGDKKKTIANSMPLFLSGISVSIIIFSNLAIYLKIIMFILGLVAAGISGRRRIVLTCILIALSLLFLVSPSKAVPDSKAVTRIQEIDLEESSLQLRLIFFKDAIVLIKENLLLGKGGGAWRALYPFEKSFLYYSKDPHSFPLKIGVEAGLIGMGLFLSLLIYVFINTIWYSKKENRVLGFALAAIFIHSFVDIDLNIGFISLTTWVLLGLFENSTIEMRFNELRINKWAWVTFFGVFLLISSGLLLSTYLANLGDKASYDEASSRLSNAISLYPIKPQNYGTFANVNYKAFQLSGDKKYLELALSEIDKAIKNDPLNYNWRLDKAFYLVENEERDLAIDIIKSNSGLIPKFQNDIYARSAYILRMAALGFLEGNEQEKGKLALEEIIQLWDKAQKDISSVPHKYYSWWCEDEILTEYDPFLLEVINAYDYLGEKDKAKALFKYLSEETITQHQWLQEI